MRHKLRSKQKDVAVPVASMGDIAFLLIIFFMLCSTFTKESSLDLQKPSAKDLGKVAEASISLMVTKEGKVYLNGVQLPAGEPEAVEYGIMALIKDKKTPDGRTVMFKCDRDIGKDVFEPLIAAAAKAGARITAVGEEAKK